jgi:hypothetical protein
MSYQYLAGRHKKRLIRTMNMQPVPRFHERPDVLRYVLSLSYEVALNGYGWRQGRYFDGMACGSRGAGAFVTAFRLYSSKFEYRAYLRGEGWSGWRTDGAASNDFSTGSPLQALQFRSIDGVPGPDLLYRGMFGTKFSALGAASREDFIGTPDTGDSLQVIQIFPVVPVYAQNPGDVVLSVGTKLDSPVSLGNIALTRAGRGSLKHLQAPGGNAEIHLDSIVLQSRACLAGIGTTAPLCRETAAIGYQSGLIVAEVHWTRAVETGAPLVEGDQPQAPAGTLIDDPGPGNAPGIQSRAKLQMHSLDIRPAVSQLLKAAYEGQARKGA